MNRDIFRMYGVYPRYVQPPDLDVYTQCRYEKNRQNSYIGISDAFIYSRDIILQDILKGTCPEVLLPHHTCLFRNNR